jgi:adenosylcobinamide-phosphate synthase
MEFSIDGDGVCAPPFMYTMYFLFVVWAAVLLDLLFGDPRWFPHPVRLIGWLAARLEQLTRQLPLAETNSGRLTVLLVLLITGTVCGSLLTILSMVSETAFFAGATFILYTTVAARDLIRHAHDVYTVLGQDIDQARKAVAMIVGRDTEHLDEAGVIRACVESVAENMSDGIVAPLFWSVAGSAVALPSGGIMWPVLCGVTAAMLYKAVNTMDSMFGYKNEQYLSFGSCPARLDDAANFFPARISGFSLVLAAPFCGGSLQNSWKILQRDHAAHTSPNAGWPEAALAGALGLQLGGESCYFGEIINKPALGDALKVPDTGDILRANRLILIASLFCLLLFSAVYFLIGLLS